VTTRTAATPGLVELEVSNSEPTVPPEQVDARFEPFARLGGDRTGHPHGAGLGLSIVRSITATHHRQLAAAARDGGGLIVRIRLAAAAPNGELLELPATEDFAQRGRVVDARQCPLRTGISRCRTVP
jgi:signal transduction histidine kinase